MKKTAFLLACLMAALCGCGASGGRASLSQFSESFLSFSYPEDMTASYGAGVCTVSAPEGGPSITVQGNEELSEKTAVAEADVSQVLTGLSDGLGGDQGLLSGLAPLTATAEGGSVELTAGTAQSGIFIRFDLVKTDGGWVLLTGVCNLGQEDQCRTAQQTIRDSLTFDYQLYQAELEALSAA